MGDDGRAYATYTPEMCSRMGQLVGLADTITPNVTESCILTGRPYRRQGWKRKELEEMAREVGISPYYLSKLFKESEGTGYIEYTTKLRMDYAKEQLGATDRSIKEICHDAGYQDPNYFSRIFKKWTGMTPTEYRGGGSI